MSTDKLYTTIRTVLDEDNYHDWKFAVSMILRHRECYDVVTGVEKKPTKADDIPAWERKAQDGLTIIGLSVDRSQYTYIREAKNGAEAWSLLKDQYEKNTRATRISLKRRFYGFEHTTDMPMQTYISGITDLAAKLGGIDIQLKDEDITDVLIFNLNSEYSSIASTLMATQGTLKISTVTSALLEEERRKGGPNGDPAIALLGKAKNDGKHPHWGTGPPGRSSNCFRCGRKGHRLRDCTAQKHANGGAITEEMEEEARRKIAQFQTKTNIAYSGVSIDTSLNAAGITY
ncbi:hypothetical protein NMY22_g1749 [Coprinellus aureogranulatus]|nr:hypothetical protein NMY22_g1749 [Coprinellus aureogranulatus]